MHFQYITTETQKNICSPIVFRFDAMQAALKEQSAKNRFLIFSGSVSMGDKDFLKPVLISHEYKIHFGRVNMKPG